MNNEFSELIKVLKKRNHECGWFQIENAPCKRELTRQFMYLNYPVFNIIEDSNSLRY